MPPLNAEEQTLLDSVELGEWQSVPDVATEIERYQHYAQAQENPLESVSFELPSQDLQALQAFAQQAGTSVSLLMASVLHQFITHHQD